jgi:hypothetical protein
VTFFEFKIKLNAMERRHLAGMERRHLAGSTLVRYNTALL